MSALLTLQDFYAGCLNPPTIFLQLHKILVLFSLMGMIRLVVSCLQEQMSVLWDLKIAYWHHEDGANLGSWSGSFSRSTGTGLSVTVTCNSLHRQGIIMLLQFTTIYCCGEG